MTEFAWGKNRPFDNLEVGKVRAVNARLEGFSPEPLDSLEDVALRLKCHKRTVSRMVAKGELKPVRFNSRMIRFKRSDIDALIHRSQR